jgi:cellulose synthase/poly-beta-1,6-N-acetylglucosamine synthase-like glycosyltransferase
MTALLVTVISLVALGLAASAMSTLWWMLHAWRDPETLATTGFERGGSPGDGPGPGRPPAHRFSLLVPARHEEQVLGATLDRLAAVDHPSFEVIAIVGHDDPETADVAEAAARRHPGIVRVVVDRSWPKNKPKALNTATPLCTGDVIGIFDAEDEVDPRLLRVVDSCFQATGAAAVQGGVQLVNFRSSWFSLRNCLEYFFWFRSRLHLHERHGFIPLGGNTVFVRTDVLRDVGGYDPECLAEDCELGVRLSSRGERIAVSFDAHLVTREETPDSIRALVRQRTRWNQGFLQVLRKGEWRRLPTRRQRLLARFTLSQPFLQAFTGIAVPISIVTALAVRAPVGVALVSFLPAVPTAMMVAFEAVGLREFCRVYYVRPRLRDYVVLAVGTPFYQVLLAWSACRAVVREAAGRRNWEKTPHSGAHRHERAQADEPEVALLR